MPKYNLLITVSGYTTSTVEAANEAEARKKFGRGEWEEGSTKYDYELEEIEEAGHAE